MTEMATIMAGGSMAILQEAFPNNQSLRNCRTWITSTTFLGHAALLLCSYRVLWLILKEFVTRKLLVDRLRMSKVFLDKDLTPQSGTFLISSWFDQWFVWLFRRFSIFTVILLILIPYIIVVIVDIVISTVVPSDTTIYDSRCFIGFFQTGAVKLIGLLYLASIFICVGFPVINSKDNLNFTTELKHLIALGFVLAGMCIINIFRNSFYTLFVQFRIWQFINLFYIPALIFVLAYYPISLSFKHQSERRSPRSRKTPRAEKSEIGPPKLTLSPSEEKQKLDMTEVSLTSAKAPSVWSRPTAVEDLTIDLERIISGNPSWRMAFLEFLQLEYSVENLLFFESANQFEKKIVTQIVKSPADIIDSANEIKDTYISHSSPFSVNLSAKTRRKILHIMNQPPYKMGRRVAKDFTVLEGRASVANSMLGNASAESMNLQELDPYLFKEAKEEILSLMAKDSFVRFRRKSIYDRMI
jgi:hypothetical protein